MAVLSDDSHPVLPPRAKEVSVGLLRPLFLGAHNQDIRANPIEIFTSDYLVQMYPVRPPSVLTILALSQS
jgi:hypothetical protein